MRLIDVDVIRLPKGFFEKVNNVPKFYEWLSEQPTIDPVKNKLQRAVDGKTEEEIYDFLDWLMHKYANQYTDSRSAVIQWLRENGAERGGR